MPSPAETFSAPTFGEGAVSPKKAAAFYEAAGAYRDVWNHSYIGGDRSLAIYASAAERHWLTLPQTAA